jgi:hypothetical protein
MMKVVIRFSSREELKALPILLRHSAGMVLPNRTYVLDPEAVKALTKARVQFTTICSDSAPPGVQGATADERV